MELNLRAVIEGILFIWGESIEAKEIAGVLSVSENRVEDTILSIKNEYDREDKGIRIVKRGGGYQMSTKPEIFNYLKEFVTDKKKKNLSVAAMETLSIIAYRQPIIKSEIEALRGVKCDSIIYNLLESELIEIKGRLDKPGKPIIYGTTSVFLKKFGLESLENLPEISTLEDSKIENISFLED